MSNLFEEGGHCPECDEGTLEYVVEGCGCHISPPCNACTDCPLTCDACDFEDENDE